MTRVSVIIPTIHGREKVLEEALASVRRQTFDDYETIRRADLHGDGPSVTRNTAAGFATGEFLAFLDDDDIMGVDHLEKLVAHADETGADVVYPWFQLSVSGVIDDTQDPLGAFGKPFDPERLDRENYIPVTALVRREMFLQVGGFPEPGTERWPHKDCEDWGLWLALRDAGAKFSHLPERTWQWNWHSRNTSGRPDRAKEIYG